MIEKKVIILWITCAFISDSYSKELNTSLLSSKLMQGIPVEAATAQYVVSLKKHKFIYCTGCLVSYKDILSTAHCAQKTHELKRKNKFRIRAIFNNKKYEIASTHPHPKFRNISLTKTNIYNLGHIQLAIDCVLEDCIQLNRISIPVADVFINIVGEIASVFGWAPTNFTSIHQINVRIEDDSWCTEHLDTPKSKNYAKFRQMCGSPLLPDQELKNIDAGSPLVYENALIGIALYKMKQRGKIASPITFIRLHNLKHDFPEMIQKSLSNTHCLNLLKSEP